jgi:prepilin-type processing-associated H-X9-DG protein
MWAKDFSESMGVDWEQEVLAIFASRDGTPGPAGFDGWKCPSDGDNQPFIYAPNYPNIVAYDSLPGVYSPIKRKPMNAEQIKNPSYVLAFTEQNEAAESTAWAPFGKSPGVWPFNTDFDGDGINDSNSGLISNLKSKYGGDYPYNNMGPRHGSGKGSDGSVNITFVDGHGGSMTIKQLGENENDVWGSETDFPPPLGPFE